jgi:hypothetical protein
MILPLSSRLPVGGLTKARRFVASNTPCEEQSVHCSFNGLDSVRAKQKPLWQSCDRTAMNHQREKKRNNNDAKVRGTENRRRPQVSTSLYETELRFTSHDAPVHNTSHPWLPCTTHALWHQQLPVRHSKKPPSLLLVSPPLFHKVCK